MQRKRKVKDDRPHWNEPIEEFKTYFAGRWYTAEEWSHAAERSLAGQKHYKNDPTYELRKRRAKPTT